MSLTAKLAGPLQGVRLGLTLLQVALMAGAARAAPRDEVRGKPNRLVKESSPYLLQHAYNPVDWYPWGEEAFARARTEKKLVFLSIGYSSCHWCHVMERESFANKEIAELLNKNFVCIKVDREERPDLDDIYMSALLVMDSHGGWPLSMFLTPDGKPIVGGTYWPPADREVDGKKVNGFKTILNKMADFWRDRSKDLQTQADHFAEATEAVMTRFSRVNPLVKLDRELVNESFQSLLSRIDPVHGGFGEKGRDYAGTKFPMPVLLLHILEQTARQNDEAASKLLTLTLDKMLEGGIYDQVGGGFHRYSTERTWTTPHFEKMLYDNAQLMEVYAKAFRQFKAPAYRKAVQETAAFIKRELTSPDGAFYSALDADSNGVEGEFYVWKPEEIDQALPDKADADLCRAVFGLAGPPNFEGKSYILRLNGTLAETARQRGVGTDELEKSLTRIKDKLRTYRGRRVRPLLDTKIIIAWNGQMIAAHAVAGKILGEQAYTDAAARAAGFILNNLMTPDGRLPRTGVKDDDAHWRPKGYGYLDDYAFFIDGLLKLHEATGDHRWLDRARALTDQVVKWYGDGERGGYFYTASDQEKLFARPKDYADNVQPSANGIALQNLIRLGRLTREAAFRSLAEKSLRQFAGVMKALPSSTVSMTSALSDYLDAEGKALPQVDEKKVEITGMETTEDVVKVAVSRSKTGPGRPGLLVSIAIAEPWHIYGNPVGEAELEGAATTIRVSAGGKAIPVEVHYPPGQKLGGEKGDALNVYAKQIAIEVELPAENNAGPLEVAVKVQACTSGPKGVCLRATTLKSTVK